MLIQESKEKQSNVEFIIVLSMLMSLTALSIDAILPALSFLADEFGITNPNDRQLVISVIFLGQALGQVFFGPLSDRIGRKTTMYLGYGVFAIGSLISFFSTSFTMMLLGRILQGLGVSSPRAVSLALVRDRFEGVAMARIMSFVMTVFILVPIVAPTFGQAVLTLAGWRNIFSITLVFATLTIIWFALRIPETLAPENRRPFSFRRIIASLREIFGIRAAVGYTLASGLVYGVFVGYLNSAQQIFQEQYQLGGIFTLVFAMISFSLGFASTLNARLVVRYGMEKLVAWALSSQFVLVAVFLGIIALLHAQPPLWGLITFLMLYFFCTGILFGNINSLAMQPLGHLAGIGSGVVGSVSTLISMVLGTVIGRYYNQTIFPLLIGMLVLSGLSILIVRWVPGGTKA